MSEELSLENLSPEEAGEVVAAHNAALQGVKEKRRQAQQDTLRAQYDAEVAKLKSQRISGARSIDELVKLKSKYRARGLEIW
jgi:hypothetical protein